MSDKRSERRGRSGWTLGIVSVGLFMVVLDNLVVSVALPSIHRDLHASIQTLEWTVNAYVLTYAAFLLTGAALGDRFGRRRMFIAGLAIFTAASAAAALAPTSATLVAARAVQGLGAAIVTPLTLTLIAAAFPAAKRGMAIGVWSGISGSRGRPRAGRRRRGRRGDLLALDLLDQRPDRPRPDRTGRPAAGREPRTERPPRPQGARARVDRRLRRRLRPRRSPVARLDEPDRARRPDRRRRPPRRVRRRRADEPRRRCCRSSSSPTVASP